MRRLLSSITNRVTTRKGVWITLIIWLIAATFLSFIAPGTKDYKVNSLSELYPDHMQSVIAQNKLDEYFKEDDGIPALFVFDTESDEINLSELDNLLTALEKEKLTYVKNIFPLTDLPPQIVETFISDDGKAAFLPVLFKADLTSKEIKSDLENIYPLIEKHTSFNVHVTGPAGIAVDTTDLFSRADLVLLFSTVGIIFILLILTYRSPLLAFIPLLAAVFVYAVVDRILGLLGKGGVELASQSLSIMMILLFAVVIDYSLFIFSRFQEELKQHDDKYVAMQKAMREIGVPIFYSSSTILLAMLVLFFAQFGDYNNFAPTFSVAVLVVMVAAVTLVPALFTLFGRNAFWPKIPRVGDEHIKTSSLWGKVGQFVVNKPIFSVVAIVVFLVISAGNVFNISYEFNTMKSFPDDMPSRVGYEILEEKFEKGDLAPTTVIYETKSAVATDDREKLADTLSEKELISSVRQSNITEDEQVIAYQLTFSEDPYDVKTIDALENIINDKDDILTDLNLEGELFFAGETAAAVDNRAVSNRDLIVIVVLESLLIFSMLIFLTRSFLISTLMMVTILFSYIAALGLGTFLSGLFFDIHTISNRVPVYAFVFLVALGIDYNIFLVSRFLEEKRNHSIKEAVATAVANTGGVISSAGVVLAATFAVLMTQPVEVLFIFGFIVAIGILMDTFLIRGVLLPGLLVLLVKNNKK